MPTNKEINDYFLRFYKIHPNVMYNEQHYENNKLVQYQKLLLCSSYEKEYIKYIYHKYDNKFKDLIKRKEKILLYTKNILNSLDKEIEYINNTYLEVNINNIKMKEYEL